MDLNRANLPSQHIPGPGFQPGAAAGRSSPAISAESPHVKMEPGVAQAAAPLGGGSHQTVPPVGALRGAAGPQNSAQLALLLGPHQLSSADRLAMGPSERAAYDIADIARNREPSTREAWSAQENELLKSMALKRTLSW